MDEKLRLELEASVFRRLLHHLQTHTDVQNIDLMNLAGFCRNCLSKWYRAEAEERGLALDLEEAREIIYGMPYDAWKARYQRPASPDKLETYQVKITTEAILESPKKPA